MRDRSPGGGGTKERADPVQLGSPTDQRNLSCPLKRRRQRWSNDLGVDQGVDLDGIVKPAQNPLADRAHPGTRPAAAEVHRGGGDQHGASGRFGAQAAGLDRGGAHPVVALAHHVAAAHAHAQTGVGAADGQPPGHRLQPGRGVERGDCAGEGRHDPVADTLDHRPTGGGHDGTAGPLQLAVRSSATSSPTPVRHAVEPTTSVNTTVTVSGPAAAMRESTSGDGPPLRWPNLGAILTTVDRSGTRMWVWRDRRPDCGGASRTSAAGTADRSPGGW